MNLLEMAGAHKMLCAACGFATTPSLPSGRRSGTTTMPDEKRYAPRSGVTSTILANAVLVLLLLLALGVSLSVLLAIAIVLVFINAAVVLVHLRQRKYGSITLSRTHVCGYRFSWSSFVQRVVMYEPVAIPRRRRRQGAISQANGAGSVELLLEHMVEGWTTASVLSVSSGGRPDQRVARGARYSRRECIASASNRFCGTGGLQNG